MKRFYQNANAVAADDGWQVHLDDHPVRTPARALLALPTATLAEAVAAEWQAQGDKVDPATMRFTGLANAAIDQVGPQRDSFIGTIAAYGETDLLCYRADSPAPLVERQAAQWDALLEWARSRYDVAFRVTTGIIHVAQPPETVSRLTNAVAAHDAFTLAGLSTLVSITGSLLCGLALVEGAADDETLWQAAELDELWQAELWGEDAQAATHRILRRAEFDAAAAFCRMARAEPLRR